MTNTASPVAAWYPDPSGQADLRWWDGTRWTGDVRPAAVPPAPERPAPVQPAPIQPGYPAAAAEAPFGSVRIGSMSAAPSTGQFGGTQEPDRFRVAYEEKSFQAWRKNRAATSALVFAGINLALMTYAFVQHYSPYYRIVPSVIGIVMSVFALRQARETETGFVKSIVALSVNVIIGLVAAVALLQLTTGIAGAFSELDDSTVLEQDLFDAAVADGHETESVVCPTDVVLNIGSEHNCVEYHSDGTLETIKVAVVASDEIQYWYGE